MECLKELCQSPPDTYSFSKTCQFVSTTLGNYPQLIPWHYLVFLHEDGSWGEILPKEAKKLDFIDFKTTSDLHYFSGGVALTLRVEREEPFMLVVLGIHNNSEETHFHQLLHPFLTAILARARVIEDRDEFISLASHEFKTPITAMKLRLELTRRKIELTPAIKLCLETLEEQTNRLNGLVEELLDMTRIERGRLTYQFVKLRVEDLITSVLKRFQIELDKAGNEIHLELEPNLSVCWCGSRMDQVFSNLISNVLKYAPGSKLYIKVGCLGDQVQITFQDKGQGIAKEKLGKVFNRFERAHTTSRVSGLGLGLYIVQEIIKGHHGTIQVESDPGMGTKFTMILPKEVKAEEIQS